MNRSPTWLTPKPLRWSEGRRIIRLWWERHNGALILWLECSTDRHLRMLGGIEAGGDTWRWVACPKRLRARVSRVAFAAPPPT